MKTLDLELSQLNAATSKIEGWADLISLAALGPFDLTSYDLQQTERRLRLSADKIAKVRLRLEKTSA